MPPTTFPLLFRDRAKLTKISATGREVERGAGSVIVQITEQRFDDGRPYPLVTAHCRNQLVFSAVIKEWPIKVRSDPDGPHILTVPLDDYSCGRSEQGNYRRVFIFSFEDEQILESFFQTYSSFCIQKGKPFDSMVNDAIEEEEEEARKNRQEERRIKRKKEKEEQRKKEREEQKKTDGFLDFDDVQEEEEEEEEESESDSEISIDDSSDDDEEEEHEVLDSFGESQDLYAQHRIVRLPSTAPFESMYKFTLSDEL